MKISTLAVSSIVLAALAGTVSAEPVKEKYGINIDLTNSTTVSGTPSMFMIKGKYMMEKNVAVLGGFGLRLTDTGAATNAKHTDIGFMFGIRRYVKAKEFSPFIGGKFQYLSVRTGATTNITDLGLLIEGGAEYFLGKQFSLEGSVGGGFISREIKPAAGASTKATFIGTTSYNLSANYYF